MAATLAPAICPGTAGSTAEPQLLVSGWGSTDTTVKAWVYVNGEGFAVDKSDGQVFLVHPQWSLVGAGRTIAQARTNLLTEASELADEMRQLDQSSLSPQARRLREFVLRIR